jgi:hypothetical protein
LATDFLKFRLHFLAQNFAPSMQNRHSLTPPHIPMYLVVFYVGEYVCMGGCVGVYTKSKSS